MCEERTVRIKSKIVRSENCEPVQVLDNRKERVCFIKADITKRNKYRDKYCRK